MQAQKRSARVEKKEIHAQINTTAILTTEISCKPNLTPFFRQNQLPGQTLQDKIKGLQCTGIVHAVYVTGQCRWHIRG